MAQTDDAQDDLEQYDDDAILHRLADYGQRYVMFELLGRDTDRPGYVSARGLAEDDSTFDLEEAEPEDLAAKLKDGVDNYLGPHPEPENDLLQQLRADYGDVAASIVDRWGDDG